MSQHNARLRKRWIDQSRILYLLGSLCLIGALLLNAVWPRPIAAQGSPVPNCPPGYTQVKFEDPSGTQTQGPITVTVTRTEEGEPKEVRFNTSGGTLVYLVYVKGSTGYRTHDYRPAGVTSGSGLVAPNRTDDRTYGISHVTFCYGPAESTPTNTPEEPTATEVVPTATAVEETETVPTATEVAPTEVAPTETEVVPTEIAPTEVVRTRTVEPTQEGNPVPTCPEGYSQVKFEDPWGVQIQGPITLIVTRYEEGEPKEVSFVVSGGFVVYLVYVKGGPGFRTYDYRPDGVTSGTGLVAPNRTDDRTYGISHVTFCYGPAESTPTNTPEEPTATEVVPTATPVSETEVVPTATEVVPTATEVASTPTQVRETAVVPTATEVEATTVVRTATSTPVSETAVVPTATKVEATTVVRTATSTRVSETAVVPTATSPVAVTEVARTPTATRVSETEVVPTATSPVENETAVRTPTSPSGQVPTATPGGETAPTATFPVENETAARTPTSAPGGDNDNVGGDNDNVGGGAATPTSVVLPDSGVRASPETLPVTAMSPELGENSAVRLLVCLALAILGLGLLFRGYSVSRKLEA